MVEAPHVQRIWSSELHVETIDLPFGRGCELRAGERAGGRCRKGQAVGPEPLCAMPRGWPMARGRAGRCPTVCRDRAKISVPYGADSRFARPASEDEFSSNPKRSG